MIANRFAVIPAMAQSDDRNMEVRFDALLWFRHASVEEILALARSGWGGDYSADAVAIFMAEILPDLAKLFAYLELIGDDPSKKDSCGFECHVDSHHALKWLRDNRPSLWAELADTKPYSVLLLYPEYADDTGYETYYAFVEAADPTRAVAEARRQAMAQNSEIDDPTDFHPLLVIEGHHRGQPLFSD